MMSLSVKILDTEYSELANQTDVLVRDSRKVLGVFLSPPVWTCSKSWDVCLYRWYRTPASSVWAFRSGYHFYISCINIIFTRALESLQIIGGVVREDSP